MNGKALVQGIRLLEMDVSDMLDVIHYYFEEDLSYVTSEQAQIRSEARTRIYSSMYDREYQYKMETDSDSGSGSLVLPENEAEWLSAEDDIDVEPFDLKKKKAPPIPYSPPTKFDPEAENPFGSVLDAPL